MKVLSILPALGYLADGEFGWALQAVALEDPLDFINPLGTSQLGVGSELRSDDPPRSHRITPLHDYPTYYNREREIQNGEVTMLMSTAQDCIDAARC